jgi:uncharacterized protein YjbI with pentapeptide repeats
MAQAARQPEDITASLRDVPLWIKCVTAGVGVTILFSVGWQFWSFWTLNQQISALEKQIQALSQGAAVKPHLQSQITTLQKQINVISDINLKRQLNQHVDKLSNRITDLPEKVFPEKLISLEKDRIILGKDLSNSQIAFYGSLVQTLGGLFFFVTAFFTWHNLRISRENLKVSEEKQVTDRFSKGVDQIGSDKIEVRLGGIYALERIAKNDSEEKDYESIMEILAGFIRERSTARWKNAENISSNAQTTQNVPTPEYRILSIPPTDIQAALSFVLNQDKIKSLDLRSSDFSWMILTHSIFKERNLQRSNFSNSDLSNADFSNSDLSHTDFSNANLSNVNFKNTILNFANLSGAILNQVRFSDKTELKSVTFSETTDFSDAALSGIELSLANLAGAKFIRATLINTKFVGANLSGANFTKAILSNADFSNAILNGADLSNTTLAETIFERADLKNTKLRNVDLNETHLTKADLENADLTGADLKNTNLETVNNLTQDQLDQASTYINAKLPNYLSNIKSVESAPSQQKQPDEQGA